MPPAHVLAWLDQAAKPYAQPAPTTLAITSSLDTYASLKIKTDQFTYDDGRTLLLLCLHGTLPITYSKAKYNVPLNIWFPIEYPSLPPIVYVVPTSFMLVRKGRGVDLDGRVNENEWDYLNGWRRKPEAHSILPLLQSLVDAFSIYPPVYAKPKDPPAISGSRPNGIQSQPQSQYLHSSASTPEPGPTTTFSSSTRNFPIQGSERPSASPPPPPPLPPAAFPPGPPLPPIPSLTGQSSPGSPSRSFSTGATEGVSYTHQQQLQQQPASYHPQHNSHSHSHPHPHPHLQPYSYDQQHQRQHSSGPNTNTSTHPNLLPNAHYQPTPSAQQSFSPPQHQPPHQAFRQYQYTDSHPDAYAQNHTYHHSFSPSLSDPRASVQPPSRANTAPGPSQTYHTPPGPGPASLATTSVSIPQSQARPQPQTQSVPIKAPIPDLLGTLDDPLPASRTPTTQPTDQPAPPPPPPNPEILHLQTHLQSSLTSTLDATLSALDTQRTHLQTINDDLRAAKPAIEDEMARLKAVRDVCMSVGDRMRSLVALGEDRVRWVAGREGGVDEVICGVDLVGNQLIDLVAEDAAISDTIYQLNRALTAEKIDLERFLKMVRILAREQFMKRALIEKILKG
ncbi:Vacuolar sorting protein/ubiquitin receptor VPS23 [Phaffia rhodozyma]|uniref:Vacuolar sorting protein/ubiquitin receptor VPS23 n=1 Tax=Phaffia rhodozyma TaxID=264483 RepID=A0A0F7SQJ6_PHARH|nr:Vacuolar sorting protein/ubiquitin receptor VPS23 [Phaffia rhodozyma]